MNPSPQTSVNMSGQGQGTEKNSLSINNNMTTGSVPVQHATHLTSSSNNNSSARPANVLPTKQNVPATTTTESKPPTEGKRLIRTIRPIDVRKLQQSGLDRKIAEALSKQKQTKLNKSATLGTKIVTKPLVSIPPNHVKFMKPPVASPPAATASYILNPTTVTCFKPLTLSTSGSQSEPAASSSASPSSGAAVTAPKPLTIKSIVPPKITITGPEAPLDSDRQHMNDLSPELRMKHVKSLLHKKLLQRQAPVLVHLKPPPNEPEKSSAKSMISKQILQIPDKPSPPQTPTPTIPQPTPPADVRFLKDSVIVQKLASIHRTIGTSSSIQPQMSSTAAETTSFNKQWTPPPPLSDVSPNNPVRTAEIVRPTVDRHMTQTPPNVNITVKRSSNHLPQQWVHQETTSYSKHWPPLYDIPSVSARPSANTYPYVGKPLAHQAQGNVVHNYNHPPSLPPPHRGQEFTYNKQWAPVPTYFDMQKIADASAAALAYSNADKQLNHTPANIFRSASQQSSQRTDQELTFSKQHAPLYNMVTTTGYHNVDKQSPGINVRSSSCQLPPTHRSQAVYNLPKVSVKTSLASAYSNDDKPLPQTPQGNVRTCEEYGETTPTNKLTTKPLTPQKSPQDIARKLDFQTEEEEEVEAEEDEEEPSSTVTQYTSPPASSSSSSVANLTTLLVHDMLYTKAPSYFSDIPKASIKPVNTPPSLHQVHQGGLGKQRIVIPDVSPLKTPFPTANMPQEAPLPNIESFKKPYPLPGTNYYHMMQPPTTTTTIVGPHTGFISTNYHIHTSSATTSNHSMQAHSAANPPPANPNEYNVRPAVTINTPQMAPNSLIVLENKVLSQDEMIDLTALRLSTSKIDTPQRFARPHKPIPEVVIKQENPDDFPPTAAVAAAEMQQQSVSKQNLNKDRDQNSAKGLTVLTSKQNKKFIVNASKLKLPPEKIADLAKKIAERTASQTLTAERRNMPVESEVQGLVNHATSSSEEEKKKEISLITPIQRLRRISEKDKFQSISNNTTSSFQQSLNNEHNVENIERNPQTHQQIFRNFIGNERTSTPGNMGQKFFLIVKKDAKTAMPKQMTSNMVGEKFPVTAVKSLPPPEVAKVKQAHLETSSVSFKYAPNRQSAVEIIDEPEEEDSFSAVDFIASLATSNPITEETQLELSPEELNLNASCAMNLSPLRIPFSPRKRKMSAPNQYHRQVTMPSSSQASDDANQSYSEDSVEIGNIVTLREHNDVVNIEPQNVSTTTTTPLVDTIVIESSKGRDHVLRKSVESNNNMPVINMSACKMKPIKIVNVLDGSKLGLPKPRVIDVEDVENSSSAAAPTFVNDNEDYTRTNTDIVTSGMINKTKSCQTFSHSRQDLHENVLGKALDHSSGEQIVAGEILKATNKLSEGLFDKTTEEIRRGYVDHVEATIPYIMYSNKQQSPLKSTPHFTVQPNHQLIETSQQNQGHVGKTTKEMTTNDASEKPHSIEGMSPSKLSLKSSLLMESMMTKPKEGLVIDEAAIEKSVNIQTMSASEFSAESSVQHESPKPNEGPLLETSLEKDNTMSPSKLAAAKRKEVQIVHHSMEQTKPKEAPSEVEISGNDSAIISTVVIPKDNSTGLKSILKTISTGDEAEKIASAKRKSNESSNIQVMSSAETTPKEETSKVGEAPAPPAKRISRFKKGKINLVQRNKPSTANNKSTISTPSPLATKEAAAPGSNLEQNSKSSISISNEEQTTSVEKSGEIKENIHDLQNLNDTEAPVSQVIIENRVGLITNLHKLENERTAIIELNKHTEQAVADHEQLTTVASILNSEKADNERAVSSELNKHTEQGGTDHKKLITVASILNSQKADKERAVISELNKYTEQPVAEVENHGKLATVASILNSEKADSERAVNIELPVAAKDLEQPSNVILPTEERRNDLKEPAREPAQATCTAKCSESETNSKVNAETEVKLSAVANKSPADPTKQPENANNIIMAESISLPSQNEVLTAEAKDTKTSINMDASHSIKPPKMPKRKSNSKKTVDVTEESPRSPIPKEMQQVRVSLVDIVKNASPERDTKPPQIPFKRKCEETTSQHMSGSAGSDDIKGIRNLVEKIKKPEGHEKEKSKEQNEGSKQDTNSNQGVEENVDNKMAPISVTKSNSKYPKGTKNAKDKEESNKDSKSESEENPVASKSTADQKKPSENMTTQPISLPSQNETHAESVAQVSLRQIENSKSIENRNETQIPCERPKIPNNTNETARADEKTCTTPPMYEHKIGRNGRRKSEGDDTDKPKSETEKSASKNDSISEQSKETYIPSPIRNRRSTRLGLCSVTESNRTKTTPKSADATSNMPSRRPPSRHKKLEDDLEQATEVKETKSSKKPRKSITEHCYEVEKAEGSAKYKDQSNQQIAAKVTRNSPRLTDADESLQNLFDKVKNAEDEKTKSLELGDLTKPTKRTRVSSKPHGEEEEKCLEQSAKNKLTADIDIVATGKVTCLSAPTLDVEDTSVKISPALNQRKKLRKTLEDIKKSQKPDDSDSEDDRDFDSMNGGCCEGPTDFLGFEDNSLGSSKSQKADVNSEDEKSPTNAATTKGGTLKNWLTTGKAISPTPPKETGPKRLRHDKKSFAIRGIPLKKRWDASKKPPEETDITDDTSPADDEDGENLTRLKRSKRYLKTVIDSNKELIKTKRLKLNDGRDNHTNHTFVEPKRPVEQVRGTKVSETDSDTPLCESSRIKRPRRRLISDDFDEEDQEEGNKKVGEALDTDTTRESESSKHNEHTSKTKKSKRSKEKEAALSDNKKLNVSFEDSVADKSSRTAEGVHLDLKKSPVKSIKNRKMTRNSLAVEKEDSPPIKYEDELKEQTPISKYRLKRSLKLEKEEEQLKEATPPSETRTKRPYKRKHIIENSNDEAAGKGEINEDAVNNMGTTRSSRKSNKLEAIKNSSVLSKRKPTIEDSNEEPNIPHKPQTPTNTTSATPTTHQGRGRYKREFNPENYFNHRLLLITKRSQLDTDEVLTEAKTGSGAVQCGLCMKRTTEAKWTPHLAEHYGVGWRRGEPELNIQYRPAVLNIMLTYLKDPEVKGLTCRMCQKLYRSALGMLTHIESCGAERQRVDCEYCHRNYSITTYPSHVRSCPARMKQSTPVRDGPKEMTAEETVASGGGGFSATGRAKRYSTLKAESKLKQMGAELVKTNDEQPDFNAKDHIKYNPPTVGDDVRKRWSSDIAKLGKGLCPKKACSFTGDKIVELEEHITHCKYITKPGYYCTYCKRRYFETEKEAIEHVNAVHGCGKDFSGSDSDCNIKTDDEQSSNDDDDLSEGADEDEAEAEAEAETEAESNDLESSRCGSKSAKKKSKISKAKTPAKTNNLSIILRKRVFERRNREGSNKMVLQKWKSFLKINYSPETLFDNFKCQYSVLKTQQYLKYLPNQEMSMKFAITQEGRLSANIGEPQSNIEWTQLERYKGISSKSDAFLFVGAPVTVCSWLPLPAHLEEQYLLVAYRKDMFKFVKFANAKRFRTSLMLFKVTQVKDNDGSKRPQIELHYGVIIEDGPVHNVSFLPSGGYSLQDNRLALVAVASVASTVNVYALPIELPKDCSDRSDDHDDVPLIEITPSFVLNLDVIAQSTTGGHVLLNPQCLQISWSEFSGHHHIFASFSNGCIGIWDVTNDPQENLNRFEVENVLQYAPLNYFYVGEKGIKHFALHYDSSGPRWLAVNCFYRRFVVYDIRNFMLPVILREEFARNVVRGMDWCPLWEPLLIAYCDSIPNNGRCIQCVNPASVMYQQQKLDTMISAVTAIHYTPFTNMCIASVDNGDVVFMDTRELHYEQVVGRKFGERRILSSMDVKQLDEQPIERISKSTSIKSENQKLESEWMLYDYDYKAKYGLVFQPLIKLKDPLKNAYFSENRRAPLNITPLMRINTLRCNLNKSAKRLVAVGYENGFIRVIYFDKDSQFRNW